MSIFLSPQLSTPSDSHLGRQPAGDRQSNGLIIDSGAQRSPWQSKEKQRWNEGWGTVSEMTWHFFKKDFQTHIHLIPCYSFRTPVSWRTGHSLTWIRFKYASTLGNTLAYGDCALKIMAMSSDCIMPALEWSSLSLYRRTILSKASHCPLSLVLDSTAGWNYNC